MADSEISTPLTLQPGDFLSNMRNPAKDECDKSSELNKDWEKNEKEVIFALYQEFFFLGLDDEPMVDMHYLNSMYLEYKLAKEEIKKGTKGQGTSEDATKASPTSEDVNTRKSKRACVQKALSVQDPAAEQEDDMESVASALDEVTQDSTRQKWTTHMTWCSRNASKVLGHLDKIIGFSVSGDATLALPD